MISILGLFIAVLIAYSVYHSFTNPSRKISNMIGKKIELQSKIEQRGRGISLVIDENKIVAGYYASKKGLTLKRAKTLRPDIEKEFPTINSEYTNLILSEYGLKGSRVIWKMGVNKKLVYYIILLRNDQEFLWIEDPSWGRSISSQID